MLSGGVSSPWPTTVDLPSDDLRDRVRLLRVAEEELARQVLEPELVRDVRLAVAVLVDVDVVPRGRAERVVVRPGRGILTRDPVGDDRRHVRLVGRHERVEVRVVRRRILRDQRRLSVARCGCRLRATAARATATVAARAAAVNTTAAAVVLTRGLPMMSPFGCDGRGWRCRRVGYAAHSRRLPNRFGLPEGARGRRAGLAATLHVVHAEIGARHQVDGVLAEIPFGDPERDRRPGRAAYRRGARRRPALRPRLRREARSRTRRRRSARSGRLRVHLHATAAAIARSSASPAAWPWRSFSCLQPVDVAERDARASRVCARRARSRGRAGRPSCAGSRARSARRCSRARSSSRRALRARARCRSRFRAGRGRELRRLRPRRASLE